MQLHVKRTYRCTNRAREGHPAQRYSFECCGRLVVIMSANSSIRLQRQVCALGASQSDS